MQWRQATPEFTEPITQLTSTQFLIPGLIDCHIHAPQMPNLGIGLDMELLDWLKEYTFPMETQFRDKKFAQDVYEKVIVSRYPLVIGSASLKKLFLYAETYHSQWNNTCFIFCYKP